MEELAKKECSPTPKGTPPLAGEALTALCEELAHGWIVKEGKSLYKEYSFDDFAQALAFVNRVGAMAEEQNHHPDLTLSWGKASIEIWTHSIGGLAESDFIFAAKAEMLR